MIFFWPFFGPVSVTEMVAVVLKSGQHDDDHATLFPDHLPEIGHSLTQGTLGHDVGWVPRIVISLETKKKPKSIFRMLMKWIQRFSEVVTIRNSKEFVLLLPLFSILCQLTKLFVIHSSSKITFLEIPIVLQTKVFEIFKQKS